MSKFIKSNTLLLIILYFILNYIYIIVSQEYAYMFTKFTCELQLDKFLLSTFWIILLIFLSCYIKSEFIYFVYVLVLILIFFGEAICFQYNIDSNPINLNTVGLALVVMFLFQNVKIKIKPTKISEKRSEFLLNILVLILFLPFVFYYIKYINIKNLFLIDVYQTRDLFRTVSNRLTGYLEAPLVRILLPYLIIRSYTDKRWAKVILFCIMVLYIFLCGALKSIYFGLLAAIYFYKRGYREKINFFLISLNLTSIFGYFLNYIFGIKEIVNIIRRIFFVPARLGTFYTEFFKGNYTYMSHSPLGLGIVPNKYGDLSLYFGSNVMNEPGLNANVGVFIEGFISFGIIGCALIIILFNILITYFNSLDINPMYAGIIFVYIYYLNTAFLSTLLVTHGLLFLIFFAYLYLRKNIST